MQAVLENNIESIKQLCEDHFVKKMYVFGSAVKGEFTQESDVDFLYEMDYSDFDYSNIDNNKFDPFLTYFDLKEKLELLLNKKVDLIANQEFKNKYFVKEMEKTKTLIYG